MTKDQALDAARHARENMQHDEAAHLYEHAADMCDDEHEERHCREMAQRTRKTAANKRAGIIAPDRQTG